MASAGRSSSPASLLDLSDTVAVLVHTVVHRRVLVFVALLLADYPRTLVAVLDKLPHRVQRISNVLHVVEHVIYFPLSRKPVGQWLLVAMLLCGDATVSFGEVVNRPRSGSDST